MDLKTRAECLDFIHGFAKSQMLFSAVELGVFEKLETLGKLCALDIAKQIEADVDGTERLLNACVSIGFLTKNKNGLFSNTEKARWCLKSVKGSLYGNIIVNKHSCYYTYGCLSKTVKTGKNCASEIFGVAGDQLYTFGGGYYKDETSTENFVQGMDGCSFGLVEGALNLFDLSKYTSICDIGGGSGIFCLTLRQMYPSMNIILVDLPQVIEVNKKNSDLVRAAKLVPGDFFKDPLPEAEVYMLNHVCEDWSEDSIKRLVTKVYKSLSKVGALLICGYCLPKNKVGESFAHVVDLNQLASCEGKMRTVDEWEVLIMEAGEFSKVDCRGSVSYFGEVIMATK